MISTWEYVNHEVTIIEISDSSDVDYIDSVTTDGHQYRIDMNLTFTFTEDSLSWSGSTFSYHINNDTIYSELLMFKYELNVNQLTSFFGQMTTDENGDLYLWYDDLWLFNRE